eukprot:10158884-Ditylum_brightwellii.AAC.1
MKIRVKAFVCCVARRLGTIFRIFFFFRFQCHASTHIRRGINARPWDLSCVLRPWGLGRRAGRYAGLTRHHPINLVPAHANPQ